MIILLALQIIYSCYLLINHNCIFYFTQLSLVNNECEYAIGTANSLTLNYVIDDMSLKIIYTQ